MRCLITFLIFLVLHALSLQVYSFELTLSTETVYPKYSFSSIGQSISYGTINFLDATTTRDGVLWIATNDSVLKFDGYQIEEVQSGIEGAVFALGVDTLDQLWMGSFEGAVVYNRSQGTLKSYTAKNTDGFPDESVTNYFSDNQGNLWLGMLAHFSKFNPANETFTFHSPWSKQANQDTSELAATNVVIQDAVQQANVYWLASYQNGLIKFDPSKSAAQIYRTFRDNPIYVKRIGALINLDTNNLLLATNDGLVRFNTKDESFHRFPHVKPITQAITQLVRAPNGDIWAAGDNLYQILGESHVVAYDKELDFSILDKETKIGRLYVDKEDTVYVMFDKNGIYQASPSTSKIKTVSGFNGTNNQIKSLLETSLHDLWIGFGRGLLKGKIANSGLTYQHVKTSNGADFEKVSAIHEGLRGQIWVASDIGVTEIAKNGTQKTYSLPDPGKLKHEIVSVVQDHLGQVWISIKYLGVLKLNLVTQEFEHPLVLAEQQLSSWSDVWLSLSPAKDKLLFVKSSNGFGILDINSNQIDVAYKSTELEFPYEKKFPGKDAGIWQVNSTLSGEEVLFSHNATHFSIFDWKSQSLVSKHVGTRKGIVGILKDSSLSNNYWLTTLSDHIYQWNERLGLLTDTQLESRTANSGISSQPGLSLPQGPIIWGGQKGLFWLDKSYNFINTHVPATLITEIKVNEKSYGVSAFSNFSRALNDGLDLDYGQNFVNIGFRSTSSASPKDNQFKYRLKGLHNEWIAAEADDRRAMFINLPSGEFVFEVIASNNNGIWSIQPEQLRIKIRPPWWKSYFAYFLYCLMAFVIIARREVRKRKETATLEKKVEKRTAELQISKSKIEKLMEERTLLTENIYHQSKTPLQLMLGNIDSLKNNEINIEDFSNKQAYEIFKLSRLTEQVINITHGEYQPSEQRHTNNIYKIVEPILLCFADISKVHGIDFHWSVDNTIVSFCDAPDIERLIQNLLENAFKYTDKGKVSVTISREDDNYIIKCVDTGIGIPDAEQTLIFQRRTRASNAKLREGDGIGLSIVKTIVDAYAGKIYVESQVASGSVFTVVLPIVCEDKYHENQIAFRTGSSTDYILNNKVNEQKPAYSSIKTNQKPHIVIVEDNLELSVYLKKLLSDEYAITVCLSAEDAVIVTICRIPDLIISDVMLGAMDGFEMIRQLRSCTTTKHIPIVLVTAKSDQASKDKGLAIGANDFVTKPFNDALLCKRIKNQLAHVQNIRDELSQQEQQQEAEHSYDRLVSNYLGLISQRYDDCELNIKDICEQLHVSSRHLERKTKHFLNMSPNEYLNDYRLSRAQEMIKEGAPIKSVYMECGFSSQSYFSKRYRQKFNKTPSLETIQAKPTKIDPANKKPIS